MITGDGSEPITDDEIVFRRVSEVSGYYKPESDRPVSWVAFRPNRNDHTGLSVWREKYKSAEEAASHQARPGTRYYVLALNVGRLRSIGVEVLPTVDEGGTGHASLCNLNTTAEKNSVREFANAIAGSLIERIHGPFGPFGGTPA